MPSSPSVLVRGSVTAHPSFLSSSDVNQTVNKRFLSCGPCPMMSVPSPLCLEHFLRCLMRRVEEMNHGSRVRINRRGSIKKQRALC
ncbi:uncharacterized protein BDR25DRAFT_2633 [Lindgomyces ingoldianus]|uniref:Uncharacterized protein n=1 Tax=Lindgomyces ingoldianus TaxID=673940 RepID=A0ACB6RE58_9PLEO|nr:uncharacterized protein BDR25DRAFT_2633 [Lindgomyces ingoldianus]KAF2477634.1 hypothetical protein BDR25DRAFT_2633 [Lindgomyces ingoldianus]